MEKALKIAVALMKLSEAEENLRKELEGVTMQDLERGLQNGPKKTAKAAKAAKQEPVSVMTPTAAIRQAVMRMNAQHVFSAQTILLHVHPSHRPLVPTVRSIGACFRELRREGLIEPHMKGFWKRVR